MAFSIIEGDTAPSISATLTADGSAVDLSGASVVFRMVDSSDTVVVDDASANVDDATEGEVSYDWQAADTEDGGTFKARWKVTFADGTIRSFPNPGVTTVFIRGDLG